MLSNTAQAAALAVVMRQMLSVSATPIQPRLANGVALTPPMGWNSYNHYSCFPNETIIQSNAKALVDLGLDKLGYTYVTPDCGWSVENRTSNGTLTWNPQEFPSGFPALSQYVHGLGLKFGVYSDSGILMCSTGQVLAGSLGYEQVDADTFAAWGADLLKYDNCYSSEAAGYPDADYTPDVSPAPRMAIMTEALANTGREILFAICEWGVDFPSAWAPALGNTWRITNDIIPAWRTIYRMVNQFVPSASFAGPGQWPDLDMLEVGNNVFTNDEEMTHFSLWAICKSPLVIGAALKDAYTSIAASSLAILMNTRAISYNQDSLGIAANLTRRWTEEAYDVWSGPLSGGRTVVAVVNWADYDQTIDLNLPDLGFQYAKTAYNVWNDSQTTNVETFYTTEVASHGTTLLELDGTSPAGAYNAAQFAKTYGALTIFSRIYGITTSPAYSLTITFKRAPIKDRNIIIETSASTSATTATLKAGQISLTVPISLEAINTNTVTIKSAVGVAEISIADPSSTYYAPSDFSLEGDATLVTCASGLCLPAGQKVGNLDPDSSATLELPVADPMAGSVTKYVEITYCNNDVSLSTSWTTGRNARNITIQVNNAPMIRLEVPLSGRSSELFSVDNGWEDSATLGVLVPGFGLGQGGMDTIVVGNADGEAGVQSDGADFVGVTIWG